MIWDLDIPQDTLQAYVDATEGIHSYIQDTKEALSDRMKCNNGTFDEHNVCQADEDGLHIPTETAFVYISTWDLRLEEVEGVAQKTGTLHYITEPTDRKGLYTVNEDGEMVRAVIKSHSDLTNLLEDNAHADILLSGNGNAMAVDLHFVDDGEVIITDYGTDNDNPINPTHVDLSWYDAHEDNAIVSRHVEDDYLSIANDRLNGVNASSSGRLTLTDGEGKIFGWPKLYGVIVPIQFLKGTGDSLIVMAYGDTDMTARFGTIFEDCSLL